MNESWPKGALVFCMYNNTLSLCCMHVKQSHAGKTELLLLPLVSKECLIYGTLLEQYGSSFFSHQSNYQSTPNKKKGMKVFEEVVGGGRCSLSLALYNNVTNSKELLNSMQSGTLEPEVAFLNAQLIPDVFPLLAAAYKTLVAESRDSLTTRTLHSELVYNYSGSKHITESFRRCGISENSTYVLVALFGASPDEMKAAEKLIDGKEIELEELEAGANNALIQKHYKISSLELGISSLADAITCRIAARDAL